MSTDRRRALSRPVAPPSTEEPPALLRDRLSCGKFGEPLVPYLPPAFNHGPRDLRTYLAAVTVQEFARARWHEATGRGPASWAHPRAVQAQENGHAAAPAALRRAGERLAAELLKLEVNL